MYDALMYPIVESDYVALLKGRIFEHYPIFVPITYVGRDEIGYKPNNERNRTSYLHPFSCIRITDLLVEREIDYNCELRDCLDSPLYEGDYIAVAYKGFYVPKWFFGKFSDERIHMFWMHDKEVVGKFADEHTFFKSARHNRLRVLKITNIASDDIKARIDGAYLKEMGTL